jgi:hypothetical protein
MEALTTGISLESALSRRGAFLTLVDRRAPELADFLRWARGCEDDGPSSSLRFEHRADFERCGSVLPHFRKPWWGVVVYSCFDSLNGTHAVASAFAEPLPAADAKREIAQIHFPASSVQYHRAQVTLTRAKRSLVSACEKAESLQDVLTIPGQTFDERFQHLARIHVWAWRRTTNFDALARGGMLEVDGVGFRPTRAYLDDSQGPASGFERIWGIPVTRENSAACEELLVRWTDEWETVASRAGVDWRGPPYDSADFENALCIFQERR